MKTSFATNRVLCASLMLIASGWTTSIMAAGRGDADLIPAVIDGNAQTVTTLLLTGAEANARNPDGFTALMLAAQNGKRDVAQLLLANGADVNAASPDGITALMLAAEEGQQAVAQLLIATGADVNARTAKRKITALMWAAMQGRHDVAKLLLSSGADIAAKTDKTNFTALDFAKGHRDVETALKHAGATDGRSAKTSLHAALPKMAAQ